MNINKSLMEDGFAKMLYPPNVRIAAKNAAKAWNNFYLQPQDHKDLIPYDPAGGYKITKGRDYKELFHITKSYDLPKNMNLSAQDITFISCANVLMREMRPVIMDIAIELNKIIPEVDFVRLALSIEDGWVLRFLFYPPQIKEIIAEYHTDKCGFTLHLWDSTPGFQRYWKNKWRSMEFDSNHLAFFISMLGQYVSNCRLKALSHRVAGSKEIEKYGRVSIVLFNTFAACDMVYNEKMGTTNEVLKPGENYDMPIDQFNKFFTKRKLIIDGR